MAISISKDVEEKLAIWAVKIGKTKEQLTQTAISNFIADLEDASLVEERLKKNNQSWTLEDILAGKDAEG